MAIRVLGYKSIVESKGTWPTNYIAKAQELKVLEDVEYKSYSDGAVRGNVAVVVWNMLTAPMWDVNGENETNGLNYGKSGNMIDKYFDNYEYIDEDEEVVVTAIAVADGKVTITTNEVVSPAKEDVVATYATYDLAEGTPFINLFGRTVSMLYNKKAEEVVMIIPSNSDKIVEGYMNDLKDKYSFGDENHVWGETEGENPYVVAVVTAGKKVGYYTAYDTSKTGIVESTKTLKDDKVKVTCIETKDNVTIDEDAIVLIDGEWASAEDIKKGDVLTELQSKDLYVVSRETVTGAFEAVTKEKDAETDAYYITVDGKNYSLVEGVKTVVEIDEDGEDIATTDDNELETILGDKDSKYYDEECTVYLNFLGEVERIEFGEIEAETAGKFYVVTNVPATWDVNNDKKPKKMIELNGEAYEVRLKADNAMPSFSKSGDVVLAKFDSKDRVTELILVATEEALYVADESNDAPSTQAEDGEEAEAGEGSTGATGSNKSTTVGNYKVEYKDGDGKEILSNSNYIEIAEDSRYKVTSNTVVVTIKAVEEEKVVTSYEVKTSKGTTALKGVKKAVVACEDNGKTITNAAYVFVWEEAKNTEKSYGIVENVKEQNGKMYITIEGEEYEVEQDEGTDESIKITKEDFGKVVVFTENDGVIIISNKIDSDKIIPEADDPKAATVIEVDDRVFVLDEGIVLVKDKDAIKLVDLDELEDDIDDYTYLVLTVSTEEDSEGKVGYTFTDLEGTTFEKVKVKKDDLVYADAETKLVIVVKGWEKVEPTNDKPADGE